MNTRDPGLRYQADESLPVTTALGLGLQLTALSVSATILITTIVVRAAGGSEAYLTWAVVAAVAIGGAATMLQSLRLGRFGMGHVLMMGSSSAFIAVCIRALAEGGPDMLATLVLVSALFQFLISERLALFRRIFTPTVSGTVLMLIPVSVMPAAFGLLTDVPEGSPAAGAQLSALVTVLVMCGFSLKGTGGLRLWAPVLGVVIGSAVAAFYGIYDMTRVLEAPWIGLPESRWPGLDLGFGPEFWALLPGFLLAAMIGSVRTISSAVASQSVSWRRARAVDFRAVQGAVATDGLSNLLSGLAGTMPNTSYSTGASLARLTGVASRNVGIAAGALFLAMAFFPKGLALMLGIPGPVFAAYLIVMMAILFMVGAQMIVQDQVNYRKGLIVGVSFLVGTGFQGGAIFPEFFSVFAGGLFNNGMTSGGFIAIFMTLFMEFTERRPRRFEAVFDLSSLGKLREFLGKFASDYGWDDGMASRLEAVGEEVLLTLLERKDDDEEGGRLTVSARREDNGAVLEFIAATKEGENLQDRIALLGEPVEEALIEKEASLRLMRHFADSIRHQQYRGVDILSVRVKDQEPVPGIRG